MHIVIVAVAGRPAAWLDQAEQQYLKRLPRAWRTRMERVPPSRKGSNAEVRQADEWSRINKKISESDRLVLLDEGGVGFSSREFAARLGSIRDRGQNLALVLGGPDGFGDAVRHSAQELWSLSSLTMPHELARLTLVEQLYRAHTILEGHPYHRD
ncbi:MAG: 23S rRNA (pseudouridine(1915)-N(3))-methyltransferase RlmH [Pseudomonadota bacterium]